MPFSEVQFSFSEVQATSHIDRTFVMAAYDPTDVLSRLRKQREDAKRSEMSQKGPYRQPNLKVQVAPTFQTNNNRVGSIPPPGSRSPYALGASPLNLGSLNGQTRGTKPMNGGRLADTRRNYGLAANSGGGGKYTIPSPIPGYGAGRYKGGGDFNFGRKASGRDILPPLPRDKKGTRKVGAGNANFFAKNKHLTGASTFFFNRVASKVWARGVGQTAGQSYVSW